MGVVVESEKIVAPVIFQKFDLNDVPILKCLTASEFMMLELNAVQKSYKKRGIIYDEGIRHSGLYLVLNGIVKVYKIGSNGKHQILKFAQKGDVIAYRSLLTNELACTAAIAYSDTVVCHIPHNFLLNLLKQNWEFTHRMMKMMCGELRESNTFVTDIAQKSVRERTAEMLLLLKEEFGVDRYNTLQFTITREDLANMVGTATESLIRIISEFRNDGMLECPGRKIRFLNTEELRFAANL